VHTSTTSGLIWLWTGTYVSIPHIYPAPKPRMALVVPNSFLDCTRGKRDPSVFEVVYDDAVLSSVATLVHNNVGSIHIRCTYVHFPRQIKEQHTLSHDLLSTGGHFPVAET